ncbi:MAG: regulatory protein RecX [Pseudomonadota bacterium]
MPPEIPDAARLERRAFAYLARYPASRARLARVLYRRAAAEARAHGLDDAELRRMIGAVVDRLAGLGLVDDASFAAGRARAMLRRGWRVAQVRQGLAQDGVDAGTIDRALADTLPDDVDPERAAAVRYARRRGLGPFRDPAERARHRERDLRVLARRGVPLGLAREVIDADDAADLDDAFA